MYLTNDQHLASMKRMRDRIANTPLNLVDDVTIGHKRSSSSWGMCCDEPDFWKEDELMFPDREPIRVGWRCTPDGKSEVIYTESSKYHDVGQLCPFDRSTMSSDADAQRPSGCFHRCQLFSPTTDNIPTKEEAVRLFDISIQRLTARIK